jgi:hypothetical protein
MQSSEALRRVALVALMMEACSSETLVLTRATRRNIPEDGIPHVTRTPWNPMQDVPVTKPAVFRALVPTTSKTQVVTRAFINKYMGITHFLLCLPILCSATFEYDKRTKEAEILFKPEGSWFSSRC